MRITYIYVMFVVCPIILESSCLDPVHIFSLFLPPAVMLCSDIYFIAPCW